MEREAYGSRPKRPNAQAPGLDDNNASYDADQQRCMAMEESQVKIRRELSWGELSWG